MRNTKTILATAYAVNPYKGSEDGMGWNFVLQIARFNNVIAITRQNNRPHIEKYILKFPNELYQNITFLYYDLPYWMRFWKKGSRGAMLYFWMWQRAMPIFVKGQKLSFDIVHNINFHNDWTPSYLWKLNKPFVWGPIGHHPPIPSNFLKFYSKSYWLKDRLALLIKKFFWNWSPALKRAIRHSNHILCMNSDVSKVLNLKQKSYCIMPSVATEDFGCQAIKTKNKFTLISAGRLVPLKGFDLTVLAFAHFMERLPSSEKQLCELVIVGSGPEKKYLEELADQHGIQPYVHFIEWIERKSLLKLYQQSSAFIFPSHEGAGMVVAEALSFGLPVVCLDNSGPGEFVDKHSGISIRANNVEEACEGLSLAILKLYENPTHLSDLSLGARKRFTDYFHWDRRGDQLQQVYMNVSL
jgi:glycosyltransferase involved in cell wall biosynthesis